MMKKMEKAKWRLLRKQGRHVSDDEQCNDEEPRIKDVLENLSQTVSRKRASDLLHSMAAFKDILFWTPRGQLLRKKRIITVTNIAELVEYILLPHNDEVNILYLVSLGTRLLLLF